MGGAAANIPGAVGNFFTALEALMGESNLIVSNTGSLSLGHAQTHTHTHPWTSYVKLIDRARKLS